MKFFISKFINKVDKKGRVSIPASFRSVLIEESFAGVVLTQIRRGSCVCYKGFGYSRLEAYVEKLSEYEEDDDDFVAYAHTRIAEAKTLSFDNEGRVILPEDVVKALNLDDGLVLFAGLGRVFELWNPQDYEDHLANAQVTADRAVARRAEQKRRGDHE